MLETRSSSPWIWAFTLLAAESRISLEIFFAFSWLMPFVTVTVIFASLPDRAGSVASIVFSESCRLTSFSLNTSRTAVTRCSLFACSSIASPDHLIPASTPLKSNRLAISFAVWLRALSISCLSGLFTMSKEDSAAMNRTIA